MTTPIIKNVSTKLLKKASIAKNKLLEENDIYLDEKHKELCEAYYKYLELNKEFQYKNKKVKYESIKLCNHILSDTHNHDIVEFKNITFEIDLLYNDYNKKFINKIYVNVNPDFYQEWLSEQNLFIKSLTPEQIYTLRCHTHDGDVIINNFILNNYTLSDNIDKIDNGFRKEDSIIISKKTMKTNRDFILFYYQIKQYLYELDNKYKYLSRLELEDYIINNYNKFNWTKILKYYMTDINNIFKICPKIKNNLVLYRGSTDSHFLDNSKNGLFNSKTLTSVSLSSYVAITYSSKNCCVMRIRLKKGSKIIYIQPLSIYDGDLEALLQFNTLFNIDYPRHKIKYYKTNNICPDKTNYKEIIVSDLTVI